MWFPCSRVSLGELCDVAARIAVSMITFGAGYHDSVKASHAAPLDPHSFCRQAARRPLPLQPLLWDLVQFHWPCRPTGPAWPRPGVLGRLCLCLWRPDRERCVIIRFLLYPRLSLTALSLVPGTRRHTRPILLGVVPGWSNEFVLHPISSPLRSD